MKIAYWGTAAAEGVPGLFCDCAVCRDARRRGGRSVRTRAQALIDDALLIDFGPDTYAHALAYGYNLAQLEHLLITHAHEDHFYPDDLGNRRQGLAHDMRYPALTVHGSAGVARAYDAQLGEDGRSLLAQGRLVLDVLQPYHTAKIGDWLVTPLPAVHGTDAPFLYVIERDGKALLYWHDGGWLKEETWDFLHARGFVFDLVSYDCTHGWADPCAERAGDGHMGFLTNLRARDRLAALGCVRPDTVHVSNHFSHNGVDVAYDEMAPRARKEGFLLSYDGLELTV